MKNSIPKNMGSFVIVAPGGPVLMRVTSVSRLNEAVKDTLERSETVFVKDYMGNALEVHRDGMVKWFPVTETHSHVQPLWVGQTQKMLAAHINRKR